MNINRNLTHLKASPTKITPKCPKGYNYRRCHYNEAQSPILDPEILQKDVLKYVNYYPDKLYSELEKQAATFYNVHDKYIIPTDGSAEGLDLIIRTFCNPQDKIVVFNPTYLAYKQYAEVSGVEVLEFDLDREDFTLNVNDFIDFCKQNNPKIIFIPNPIAHTGRLIQRDDLIKITQNLPNTFVVIDEAYIEFTKEKSMLSLIEKYENLVVTRTLSKFFGLAGIRLGFIFTGYKEEILKVKSPDNVSSMSCQIGINLFLNLNEKIIEDRYQQNIYQKEETIGWLEDFMEVSKIYESNTNFLFIELNDKAEKFAEKLLNEHHLHIRTFSGKFENFCRISF